MGNNGSASGVVPSEFYLSASVGVPEVALRSGINYVGSRYLLHSLGMASGVATPVALVLTALEVAYVQSDVLLKVRIDITQSFELPW